MEKNYAYTNTLILNQFQKNNSRNIYAIHQIILLTNLHLTIFMIKIRHKNKYIKIQPGKLLYLHYKYIIKINNSIGF